MKRKEIVLVSTGTRGDFAPFVAYAKKLQGEGRDVSLLSNSNHAALAGQHGIAFAAISAPDWAQINRDEWAFFNEVVVPGYYATYRYVAERVADRRELEIIARTGAWGAQYVAERFDLPFTRVALQPCAIRQNGHPAETLQIDCLNQFRKDIGLHPIKMDGYIPETWASTISFFPKWFGEPQTLWPQSGHADDFVFLDDHNYRPDHELDAFLRAHRPILMSLGSGVQEIDIFWKAASRLAAERNLPVLFLSAYQPMEGADSSPLLLRRDFLDHSYILKNTSVFINNGGIGAVAQGIRAKVPQIIFPLMWDQPDNAERVQAHGLGTVLSADDISSGKFLTVAHDLYIRAVT